MAELDNIPVKNTIQVETVKLDDDTFESIKKLNERSNILIANCGNLHLRKKELMDELDRIENSLKLAEDEFKSTNLRLNEIGEGLDDKYPQARINIQDGTITYQPGAPTRKQQLGQQNEARELKVVEGEAPSM